MRFHSLGLAHQARVWAVAIFNFENLSIKKTEEENMYNKKTKNLSKEVLDPFEFYKWTQESLYEDLDDTFDLPFGIEVDFFKFDDEDPLSEPQIRKLLKTEISS